MPSKYPISSKDLYSRISLTKEQFNHARKQLYEGLYIIRNPINKFVKVRPYRNLTKGYARKYVLKRILKNFGIFDLESLSSFTKREYYMKELREILLELENDGDLKKGYFIKDDDTLYWMVKDDIENMSSEMDDAESDHRLIVSPQDQLTTYLAPMVRQRFGYGSCFIIFRGYEISGTFKIKKQNKKIKIIDFQGDDDDWRSVEKFFRAQRLELIDEDTDELYEDPVE
jgi:hypothetical protein